MVDISTGRRVRPRCARCGRFVDRFEERQDDHLRKLILTAYCHGEVERVDLPLEDLESGPSKIELGLAFTETRRLGP
jgi:hypothetical protein